MRLQLWRKAFDGVCALDAGIDLRKRSQDYELAGGAIINLLRYCALDAIRPGVREVGPDELMRGMRGEYRKDNKTLHPN